MKVNIVKAIALFLFLPAVLISAQEVEFNYEGLVKLDGVPYNGPGYFKFSIVNKQGDVTLWSNDGTVAGGVEPATAVSVDVLDGVFNVIIGDASMANMEPLVASIFNAKEKVYLRVWFSDSLAGPYEQLSPDRAITNPALLGSQLFSELDVYVDPVLGDDRFPGLHSSHPKRTIQAAWDALPSIIKEGAMIHLAEGVYREEVLLKGKTVVDDATIVIVGNPLAPHQVRITGADAGAETTPVRDYGFRVDNQRNLAIQGVQVDYCAKKGILATQSSLTVTDAELSHCYTGLEAQTSVVTINNVTASFNGGGGFRGFLSATLLMTDCVAQDNVIRGIALCANCTGYIDGCLMDGTGSTQTGFLAENLSFAFLTSCIIRNNDVGLKAQTGGVVNASNGTGVSYSGNTTNTATNRGGQIY